MKDECKDCPLIEDCPVKDFVDLAAPQIPCPFKAANRLPKGSTIMSKEEDKKECPKCGGKPFWRRFNTPINGVVKTTLITGCKSCHTATIVEEKVKT